MYFHKTYAQNPSTLLLARKTTWEEIYHGDAVVPMKEADCRLLWENILLHCLSAAPHPKP